MSDCQAELIIDSKKDEYVEVLEGYTRRMLISQLQYLKNTTFSFSFFTNEELIKLIVKIDPLGKEDNW